MFNLLRRSKKKKQQKSKSPKAARYSYSASAAAAEASASSTSTHHVNTSSDASSRYRAYIEGPVLPDVLGNRRRGTGAHLAESEDLNDFDDLRAEDGCDVAGRGRAGKFSCDATESYYFNRNQGERTSAENVNLARGNTAANRFKVANSKYSYVASADEEDADDDYGGTYNSAISTKNKIFAFGKLNGDKIEDRTVIAKAYRPNDEQCGGRAIGGKTTNNASVSQNEEAVWPGRVLPFARRKEKYIIDHGVSYRSNIETIKTNQYDNCTQEQKQRTKRARDAEYAGNSSVTATTSRIASSNEERNVRGGSDIYSHSPSNRYSSDTEQQRQIQGITATAAEQTVINEVKYRNLDNNTHKSKIQKNSESKRQSRLSLTLGLNLTSGRKSKSVVDVRSDSSCGSTFERASGRAGSNSGGGYFKRSQFGKAFRYSFLRGRSKSTENEPYDSGCKEDPSFSAPTAEVTPRPSTGALQKSKEFLSDIFMARGRNHNRNRNQHQQQQQQHQQLQQQPQQQLPTTHNSSGGGGGVRGGGNKLPQRADSERHNYNDNSSNSRVMNNGLNGENNGFHNGANYVINGVGAAQHLETNSDPAMRAISRTNSYQITAANNSTKNTDERAVQRNSAERKVWGMSEQDGNVGAYMRSRSVDTRSTYHAGASESATQRRAMSVEQERHGYSHAPKRDVDSAQILMLNTGDRDARSIIREHNVEWNGIKSDDTARNAGEVRQRNNTACNNNKSGSVYISATCNKEYATCNTAATAGNSHDALTCHASDTDNSKKSAPAPTTTSSSPISYAAAIGSGCIAYETTSNVPQRSQSQSQSRSPTPVRTPTVTPETATTAQTPTSATSMGQTAAKCEATSSRASTPRDFRENVAEEVIVGESDTFARTASKPIAVPTITVVDCSGTGSSVDTTAEQEVFYDFENESPLQRHRADERIHITAINDDPTPGVHIADCNDDDDDDEVFHEQEIPATVYQHNTNSNNNKWSMNSAPRYNHTKLENVPEQEEDEDDEQNTHRNAHAQYNDNDEHNLDTELEGVHFDSPERNPLKSTNTSDSNLSNSYPDSGIGSDSQCSTSNATHLHSHDNEISVSRSTSATRRSQSHSRSRSPVSPRWQPTSTQSQRLQQRASQQHLPFVRDGNSTDCDESLMQCDDLDYIAEVLHGELQPNERLVCIESISLPDVVVESTTAVAGASNTTSSATASASTEQQIININGATGNSMGNVHFIPIHVEDSSANSVGNANSAASSNHQQRSSPKQWCSVDDTVLGSGGNIKSFNHLNGMHTRATITELSDDTSNEKDANLQNSYHHKDSTAFDPLAEKLKRELLEEKSRHSSQINDAQRNVQNLQNKVGEMQTKIEKLEQELSTKAWNVERLQSELNAAQKDDDYVRRRLKIIETEKTDLRHKYNESEDEFKRKYEELEAQYKELEEKYKVTKVLASNLQTQLAKAQTEAQEWRKEVDLIREELEEQTRILKNALENSEAERKICQDKWQKEFEMLRTHNMDREETLMTDCEWQLRQMQKQCKDKVDKVIQERKDAKERAEKLEVELEEHQKQVEDLKVYESEVKSLRGVVTEQEQAIKTLMDQIDGMNEELETTKATLEEQMKAVQKIKLQCDNAIRDKEREVTYRINEVRHQAAVFWEDKLYTEMTRLKNELESVYVDDRREALDKLQAEHIEELRALTTRYTANEDELRIEYNELQERFERKSEEFLELRDKSDNALLQIRMHLDRADREYQNAMCREEERREAMEENLRKEFETEKEEMEEKFRERLSQVKEEFATELQHATQEIKQQHRKELEQQKAKLQAEREEALHELGERHRKKLAAAEEQMKEIELRHLNDLKDLKATYDEEKLSMDKRDMSNSNEIEQLHRKCRCLTNLFEEMRMRYERRDPRPEDLREIAELRSRCESQERDLFELTDRLREMQMQMSLLQANGGNNAEGLTKPVGKSPKKPPPKTIPTNCDVIYEENEERDSPPPTSQPDNEEEEDDEEVEDDEDEEEEEEEQESVVNKSTKQGHVIQNGEKVLVNGNTKKIDTINEDDDESHMISAV